MVSLEEDVDPGEETEIEAEAVEVVEYEFEKADPDGLRKFYEKMPLPFAHQLTTSGYITFPFEDMGDLWLEKTRNEPGVDLMWRGMGRRILVKEYDAANGVIKDRDGHIWRVDGIANLAEKQDEPDEEETVGRVPPNAESNTEEG